jgi:ABC-type branched-subunit amino acid transport system ATPase component
VSAPLLEVQGLTKRFGGLAALSAVTFAVRAGEVLGIIGPNGSGKTTLVNCLTGFVRPTAGRVRYGGRDITAWAPHRIARLGVARTFQMVRPFYHLPAYKNLVIPLCSPRLRRLAGGAWGDRDEVAVDLLEEVGFERDSAVPWKVASALPHGYLKRLELARCVALRPEVLVLDELFSGLSLAEVASLLPLIEKLRAEGKTILMVEHRLRELFRIAGRVLVLNFGEKIAEGAPEEVMATEAVRLAYLGGE